MTKFRKPELSLAREGLTLRCPRRYAAMSRAVKDLSSVEDVIS